MTTKITLYESKNYGGRTIETSCPIENLNNYNFNDMTSSCKIEGNNWILYGGTNFSGGYSILSQGNYADGSAMGINNDALSSARPYPDATATTIMLFRHADFGGQMVTLNGAESDLHNVLINDSVSSIIVLSGTWNLYKGSGFSGEMWTVSANGGTNSDGRYPTSSGFFGDNNISSAKPV